VVNLSTAAAYVMPTSMSLPPHWKQLPAHLPF
jgi:hypothetical protein